ncbi:MAG: Uma2 family endonuclease [Fimbriimonas sp.]
MEEGLFQRPPIDEAALQELFRRADEIGLRLEMVGSGITWEAAPGLNHQREVGRIYSSIVGGEEGRGCGCFQILDLNIVLRDGTVKRPDLCVYCELPAEGEGFVHKAPETVIEITSPGYEEKDLVEGPPIYLRNGVRDVLVLDRRTNEVHHWSPSGHAVTPSPRECVLACGCRVTV